MSDWIQREFAMAFTATSPAFRDGQPVPKEFTCDGKDNAPPITVSGAPQETESFAVIMDDPDAPKGTFTHWLAHDIPADGNGLRTTAGTALSNDFGRKGYGGPCPPPGHGPHRYFFTVYAVDVPRLEVPGDSRADLEAALARHTLAKAQFMGRYERTG
jgi:Raf kinase inhibitor-like YbhB/YbcL family protein